MNWTKKEIAQMHKSEINACAAKILDDALVFAYEMGSVKPELLKKHAIRVVIAKHDSNGKLDTLATNKDNIYGVDENDAQMEITIIPLYSDVVIKSKGVEVGHCHDYDIKDKVIKVAYKGNTPAQLPFAVLQHKLQEIGGAINEIMRDTYGIASERQQALRQVIQEL